LISCQRIIRFTGLQPSTKVFNLNMIVRNMTGVNDRITRKAAGIRIGPRAPVLSTVCHWRTWKLPFSSNPV
jgi:hypothetical protein